LKIWSKNKKIIMSMSSNILELVIYERKKFSKKNYCRGFYHCGVVLPRVLLAGFKVAACWQLCCCS
jgi:hypothetical protein